MLLLFNDMKIINRHWLHKSYYVNGGKSARPNFHTQLLLLYGTSCSRTNKEKKMLA